MRAKSEKTSITAVPEELGPVYRALFEASHDVIVLADESNRIVDVNPRAARVTGYALPRMRGMDVPRDLAVPEDADRLRRMLAEVRRGEARRYEVRWKAKDGLVVEFDVITVPLVLPGRQGVFTFCSLRDIGGRKAVERELRESEKRLQQILATLPVGVAVLDGKGDVTSTNPMSRRIWGGEVIVSAAERWARSTGRWHESGKTLAASELASARALREGRTTLNQLIDIETFDGRPTTIQNSAAPIRNEDGDIVGAVVVNEDVTERVRAESELRRALGELRAQEELLGTIFQHAPIGLVLFAPDGRVLRVNAKLEQMLGYTEAELLGKSGWELLHPDDVASTRALRDQLYASKRKEFAAERRFVQKTGQVLPTQIAVALIHETDGSPSYAVALVEDISERKLAEAAIRATSEKLQLLSRRLVELQENERRDIARELHDRVGQALTAMRINMDMIRKRLDERDDPAIRARNDDSLELLESTFKAVENVMYELRPPMLDEFGVIAPLQWFVKKFTERTGIEVEIRAKEGWRGAADTEVALFRIAQEALTNVARHARARHAVVEFREDGPNVVLTIEDDGMGFDESAERLKTGHGLTAMRERAEAVGGTLEARSEKGRGTRIRAEVPAE